MVVLIINPAKKRPSLDTNQLEAICRILGDTQEGLSGSEIGKLLSDAKIPDTDPLMTKLEATV